MKHDTTHLLSLPPTAPREGEARITRITLGRRSALGPRALPSRPSRRGTPARGGRIAPDFSRARQQVAQRAGTGLLRQRAGV